MLALIQRVTRASVTVEGEIVGTIGSGLLAFVAVEPGDGPAQVERTCARLLGYRIFDDEHGRMNRCLTDTGGGLLLVSQFTLAADTRKGMRPGFSTAADPTTGLRWFEHLVELARARHPLVACGRYGAHMQVELVNDGPATFLLAARAQPA
ncbi:MAG: D-tyrosyl-tRNA(Tyr) deacylase [Proteobacteria bacterium]|nr:D-tyrosyl-tRNA(Tyr) deacylase [Pseudomonadota bacterium]